ncbi:uncharacterized protein LOC135219211 [Macrobrachium nipponense]|uniref:uncharacterized protein LOC135219211 n=1 Tax=Macrobrachium nipponense TaxID=159736 RepID=UPI0030C84809
MFSVVCTRVPSGDPIRSSKVASLFQNPPPSPVRTVHRPTMPGWAEAVDFMRTVHPPPSPSAVPNPAFGANGPPCGPPCRTPPHINNNNHQEGSSRGYHNSANNGGVGVVGGVVVVVVVGGRVG